MKLIYVKIMIINIVKQIQKFVPQIDKNVLMKDIKYLILFVIKLAQKILKLPRIIVNVNFIIMKKMVNCFVFQKINLVKI